VQDCLVSVNLDERERHSSLILTTELLNKSLNKKDSHIELIFSNFYMSVIQQLNLPFEIQELIRNFVYYNKIEFQQRKKHGLLEKQLRCCERLFWKDSGLFYSHFYYKIENWNFYTFDPNIFYIEQEIQVLSSIFCKECHDYVSSNTPIPSSIECKCIDNWIEVD